MEPIKDLDLKEFVNYVADNAERILSSKTETSRYHPDNLDPFLSKLGKEKLILFLTACHVDVHNGNLLKAMANVHHFVSTFGLILFYLENYQQTKQLEELVSKESPQPKEV